MSMAAEPEAQVPLASQIDPGTAARRLVRTALKASLATLDRDTGHPYPSLVLVATEPDGSPILLISRLAQHTRNLEADARAAILFDGTDGFGDPLAGGRVTVSGEVRPTTSPTALRRFLARHASAQGYSAFPDFSAYALTISKAHFIGGFGRIVGLDAPALITPVDGADALINAEAGHRRAHERGPCRRRRFVRNPACRLRCRRMAHGRHRSRRMRFAASHQCSAHRFSGAGAFAGRSTCGVGRARQGSALAYWSDRLTRNRAS